MNPKRIPTMICWCRIALVASLLFSGTVKCYTQQKITSLSLNNKTQLSIDGPHRFMTIAGITGLHIESLKTKAYLATDDLNGDKGTLSIWMSPLNDINKAPNAGADGRMLDYPIVSDYFPARFSDSCNFSLYYQGRGYPRVIGRFTNGSFWGQMDYGLAPFVYAEDLPLKKGQWYCFTLTWDKTAAVLKMFINGQLVGHNFSARSFKQAGRQLFLGNPLMVLSHLVIQPEVLDVEAIKRLYQQLRPATNNLSDKTIRDIVVPQPEKRLPFKLDNDWKKIYSCSFTDSVEFTRWIFQTGDLYRNKFKTDITKDGLYFETPNIIHTESRGYLWSPVVAEGDQWIEY